MNIKTIMAFGFKDCWLLEIHHTYSFKRAEPHKIYSSFALENCVFFHCSVHSSFSKKQKKKTRALCFRGFDDDVPTCVDDVVEVILMLQSAQVNSYTTCAAKVHSLDKRSPEVNRGRLETLSFNRFYKVQAPNGNSTRTTYAHLLLLPPPGPGALSQIFQEHVVVVSTWSSWQFSNCIFIEPSIGWAGA